MFKNIYLQLYTKIVEICSTINYTNCSDLCVLFSGRWSKQSITNENFTKFISTSYLLQHFNLFSKYFFPDNISVILPLVNKYRLIFQILVLEELLSGNSEKQKIDIQFYLGCKYFGKGRV